VPNLDTLSWTHLDLRCLNLHVWAHLSGLCGCGIGRRRGGSPVHSGLQRLLPTSTAAAVAAAIGRQRHAAAAAAAAADRPAA
jgi:hypothetical protein